jgi:sulfur-oxidizing protein SoxZ
MTTKPRVKIPETAKVGEIIEVRTLINHVMETGLRRDRDGKPVPRHIINSFTASYAGKTVFKATLHPATSANPFLQFYMRVPGPGEFTFAWVDDAGATITETVKLNVE